MSFFRQRTGSNLAVFAAFLVLSVAMRIFTFFPTVISHDESTFLVIAREMLMGKTYFADLVDTKPIGIFVLLSLFIKYISTSIFMVRFFAALFVGATAYMIYRINLYDTRETKPALAGGVIFIFFVSTWEFIGIFINPELFYLFFTSLGFYIFIRYKTPSGFFVTGLLLGTGFILKYVVLFDLAAWLLFYFIGACLYGKVKKEAKFSKLYISGIGLSDPFRDCSFGLYLTGHLKELFYYTFTVTSRFPTERTLVGILVFIGDFHLRFLPVIFFFYYVMIKDKETNGHR
jgi:4-amino-4-deoxy-L-arabinose transferase-like glycosyltransferase